MAEEFPELRVVKGTAIIPGVGGLTYLQFDPEALAHPERYPPAESSHWWCVAPDGTILDPTGDQFTEVLEYRREMVYQLAIQPKRGTSDLGQFGW